MCRAGGRHNAGIMGHLRQLAYFRLGRPCCGQSAAGPVDQGAPEAECAGQLASAPSRGHGSSSAWSADPRGVVQQVDCCEGGKLKSWEGNVGSSSSARKARTARRKAGTAGA
jgi:hypothetical protein